MDECGVRHVGASLSFCNCDFECNCAAEDWARLCGYSSSCALQREGDSMASEPGIGYLASGGQPGVAKATDEQLRPRPSHELWALHRLKVEHASQGSPPQEVSDWMSDSCVFAFAPNVSTLLGGSLARCFSTLEGISSGSPCHPVGRAALLPRAGPRHPV